MEKTLQELQAAFEQFKAALNQRDEEMKTLGHTTASTEQKMASIESHISSLEQAVAAMQALAASQPSNEEKADPMATAFKAFMREGVERMNPELFKTLVATTDATGGYLAPPSYATDVIKAMYEYSPIRRIARVRSGNAKSVKIRRRTSRLTGGWVTEGNAATASDSGYDMVELTAYPYSANTSVSAFLLGSADINVEGEILSDLAEDFGIGEGKAFIAGTGSGQPTGFLTGIDTTGHVTSVTTATATTVAYADMIDAMAAIGAYYSNATWLLNAKTLASLRKLKTTTDGIPLWGASLDASNPLTILGRPYLICPDMDDIADGKFPVAVGDFSMGYTIYDSVQVPIIRDPYTQSTKGLVVYTGFKFTGADVSLPEAITALKVKAAG